MGSRTDELVIEELVVDRAAEGRRLDVVRRDSAALAGQQPGPVPGARPDLDDRAERQQRVDRLLRDRTRVSLQLQLDCYP